MRSWIVIADPALGAAVLCSTVLSLSACSGAEAPPPPPPTTTEAPVEPPTTATTEPDPTPIEAPSTPIAPTTPPAPRVLRTLALTYAGGCALHEARVSCWGQSPREDEDDDMTERAEIQLSGDYVDLAASDTIACATRPTPPPATPPPTATAPPTIPPTTATTPRATAPTHESVCFGVGDDIADDVRELDQDEGDDWTGDDEEVATIDLASEALRRSSDLALGEAGGCVVRPHASGSIVACGGDGFEARALEGVRGTEGIVEVCVGGAFACGRTSDGHVRCWGDNDTGQLGDGLEDDHAESASDVRGLDHALHIGCGALHACALRDDHTVWCWGDNGYGSLARGEDLELSRTPLRVEGIENAASIAVGSGATCALFDEGPPRCWGDGDYGRLGTGNTHSSRVPVEATAIGPVRELAFGETHACAVRGDDAASEVVCWGLGSGGAIGPRARRRDYEPVVMFAGLTGISRIDIGGSSICALIGDDPATAEIRCAGRIGADPEAGVDAARVVHVVPRSEVLVSPTLARLVAGASGARTYNSLVWSCTLDASRHFSCTSRTNAGLTSGALDDVSSVAVVSGRICVLRTSGAVECAADVAASTTLSFAPLAHLPLASALVSVTGAPCVVTRDEGRLVCEGTSSTWQRGIERFPAASEEDAGPAPTDRPATPAMYRYLDVANIAQVTVQGGLVVRLTDDRVLRVTQTAAPAQLLDRAITLVEGTSFSCARRRGDQGAEAWCWGNTDSGQLARAEPTTVAIRIPGLTVPLPAPPAAAPAEGAPPIDLSTQGVTEIVVRDANACARLSDGRVLCWGADENGQLARAPSLMRVRPVVVLD